MVSPSKTWLSRRAPRTARAAPDSRARDGGEPSHDALELLDLGQTAEHEAGGGRGRADPAQPLEPPDGLLEALQVEQRGAAVADTLTAKRSRGGCCNPHSHTPSHPATQWCKDS